ncbi:MAG: zinc ABC transporter substrate-binding protein, partial [Verrucomicrobiota bacterium]
MKIAKTANPLSSKALRPILGTFLLVFAGLANPTYAKKPTVTATTGMVGDMVRNVAGPQIEVFTLMGPGVDPHLYKASATDVSKLSRSDLIFYNGLYLEGRMAD